MKHGFKIEIKSIPLFQSVLAIIILISLTPNIYAQNNDAELYIRSIHLIRAPIFDSIETSKSLFSKISNDLHIKTREKVIQRNILFKKGTRLDKELIQETSRKLRKMDILSYAKISIDTVANDSVDIWIFTKDSWSLLLYYDIETGGGLSRIGLGIHEYNFLGYGKDIDIYVERESDVGTNWSFSYDDRQLFGSRWHLRAGLLTGPLNKYMGLFLANPFHSSDTKWSYGTSVYIDNEDQRLFENSKEISRVRFQSEGFGMYADRRFGKRYNHWKLGLSYNYQNRRFSDLGELTTTTVPDDELIHGTYFSVSKTGKKYVEETKIKRLSETEDISLGYFTDIQIGKTGFPINRGVKRFEFDFEQKFKFRILKRQYLFLNFEYKTKVTRDEIISGYIRYYFRLGKYQTLAFNIKAKRGNKLEATRQFILGGHSGLRGYPARLLTGSRKLLINLEDRIFTEIKFLGINLGAVVFMDAGYVWETGDKILFSDIKASAGFGIRLGMEKVADSPVMRIDLGFPFDGRPPGIVIGMGQIF